MPSGFPESAITELPPIESTMTAHGARPRKRRNGVREPVARLGGRAPSLLGSSLKLFANFARLILVRLIPIEFPKPAAAPRDTQPARTNIITIMTVHKSTLLHHRLRIHPREGPAKTTLKPVAHKPIPRMITSLAQKATACFRLVAASPAIRHPAPPRHRLSCSRARRGCRSVQPAGFASASRIRIQSLLFRGVTRARPDRTRSEMK